MADPVVCRMAFTCATRIAEELEKYSRIIDPKTEEAIPRFDRDEIALGDFLGSGGFNSVFELQSVNLISGADMDFTEDQQESRQVVSKRASHSRYAIKFLNKEVMNHAEDFCNGAADLMVETKLLASLKPHPNIIRLRGLAAAGPQGFAQGLEAGYFLIIDRLYDTLDKRIDAWSEQCDAAALSGQSQEALSIKINQNFLERLRVSCDLCSALKHLHKQRIIFRDMKPDNVGFDVKGTVKLFDFGLAKELNPQELTSNEMYDMSGKTGSRRYMAPEVALCEAYGLSADTYSFGVMLWQICAMKEPYSGMTKKDHLELIVKGHGRPKLDETWSTHLRNVMKWSWLRDPCLRPPMKEIHRALKHEIKNQEQVVGVNESRQISQDNPISHGVHGQKLDTDFTHQHHGLPFKERMVDPIAQALMVSPIHA